MKECPSCGDRWLGWEIATHLDELLSEALSAGAEVATRHYDQHGAVPAA